MNEYVVLLTEEGRGGNIRKDLEGETPEHALAQLEIEGRYRYSLFVKNEGKYLPVKDGEYVYRKEPEKEKPYEITFHQRLITGDADQQASALLKTLNDYLNHTCRILYDEEITIRQYDDELDSREHQSMFVRIVNEWRQQIDQPNSQPACSCEEWQGSDDDWNDDLGNKSK